MNRGGLLGPDGRPAIGKRRIWMPRDLGLVVESWCDDGLTLGDTPRASGTTPPVLTLSASPGGSLTGKVFPYIQIDGAGTRGTATFKVSYDDGATFPHTGIVTAATNVLPGIGAHITANWAAGTYATNNIYEPLCAAGPPDVSGHGAVAVQATAANQLPARMVAFNGKPCLDWGLGVAGRVMATPNVSVGAFFWFAVLRGDASSGHPLLHNVDAGANGAYIFRTAPGSRVERNGSGSTKSATGAWTADGVRKTIAGSYDGTHAGHLLWVNGVQVATTDHVIANPGTATATGPLRLGGQQAGNFNFRGLLAGWVMGTRPPTAVEMLRLHNYAIRRFPL
jgi:hypothetical protein